VTRIRSEVESRDGGVAVYVDLDKYTPEQLALAQQILDDHIDQAAEATGEHPDRIREFFMVELTLRIADAAAYVREAARRGVLAL